MNIPCVCWIKLLNSEMGNGLCLMGNRGGNLHNKHIICTVTSLVLSCAIYVTINLTMRHEDIERYLKDVLGLTAIVKPWAGGVSVVS